MLLTYARRELTRRRRQTIIVSLGLALAVALVILVSGLSTGVQAAQNAVLTSVYGVGTDITVTQAAEFGTGGRQEFNFGQEDGTTNEDGSTEISSSVLMLPRMSAAMDESAIDSVLNLADVSAATGVLELQLVDFSGALGTGTEGTAGAEGSQEAPPEGGRGGFGGGMFSFDQTTVTGIPETTTLGPIAAATVTEGRAFESSDSGASVALISAAYAAAESLTVGDSLTVADSEIEIIGIVVSDQVVELSDIYLPLTTAQTLASMDGQISDIYVQAANAGAVDAAAEAISGALPEATVSTQSDLANSVAGTVSTASSLVSGMGLWLTIGILVAAFVLAILFTVSSVNRRTRDFGTLKAIGWSDRRVTAQVALESFIQALIGAGLGIVVALAGILAINAFGITLSGSSGGFSFGGGAGMPAGFTPPEGVDLTALAGGSSAVDVALTVPVDVQMMLLGLGVAVLGGAAAAAVGGWRASRLKPALALRSVD